MIKVSIIVPVYNSEKYLQKCLDSLINQTLNDIEIIVVNDCSIDSSKKIINQYKNKYGSKILDIYLSKNKGQGNARNIAIERAIGEYILFVDSDDYIELDTCEILYKKAKEKAYDIICFDITKIINQNYVVKKLEYDSSIEGTIDLNKRKKLIDAKGYFSTRMYKRKLIIDNNLKFPIGIHYEDSVFNTLSLLYANNVAKIDKPLYFYLIRRDSSSNSYNQERLYDRITTTEFMLKEVKKRQLYDKYKSIVDMKYLKMTVGNIHLCLDMFDKVNKNKLKEIKNNFKKNIDGYESLGEYKNLDKVSKLYLRLNNISQTLVIVFDKIYKNILKILKS